MKYLFIELVLISLLLLIYILSYKKILPFFDGLINDLRLFIYKNDSLFTILFLFIFFFQQLLLIVLSYFFNENVIRLQVLISIFALIVVTTSSLQKLILDIRVRHFKEQSIALSRLYHSSQTTLNMLKKLLKK